VNEFDGVLLNRALAVGAAMRVDGIGQYPEKDGMRVLAFIEPCLPSPADQLPSGPGWIHEIKLDGFRMMVRRDPAGVRLLTRNGHEWTGPAFH
jgi:ATP-dependent DNA ligase